MKDELDCRIIKGFMARRPKICACLIDDGQFDKKGKGTKNVQTERNQIPILQILPKKIKQCIHGKSIQDCTKYV